MKLYIQRGKEGSKSSQNELVFAKLTAVDQRAFDILVDYVIVIGKMLRLHLKSINLKLAPSICHKTKLNVN